MGGRLAIAPIAALLALAAGTAQASGLEGTTVDFCSDGAGWPPYTYFAREEGRGTDRVVGYDVDVLDAILTPRGIEFRVHMPPWKRCLVGTEAAKGYHVALSASYSAERDAKYLMTAPYYWTTAYYFYDRERHPDGLAITRPRDLVERGRLCGLHGYNYESMGDGIRNSDVLRQAKTYGALVKMILAGRCDLFTEKIEVMAGFALVGQDHFAGGRLGYRVVPYIDPVPFYMLISREFEHAAELKRIIDQGVKELLDSGRLDEMLGRYMPSR